MKIIPVNSFNQGSATSFGVNLNSKKLRFSEDDFYVRIKGFGHHSGWAKKICETADNAVNYIRQICNFEETLKKITDGVTEANKLPLDIDKRNHTGILRIARDGWRHGSDWDSSSLITRYSKNKQNRYNGYADRLDHVVKHPLSNPFRITLTRPIHDKDFGKYINHGNAQYINAVFYYANMIYQNLYSKFISQEVKQENMTDLNNLVAELKWLLAHGTPWERGSDAISNTFIRSIYKAAGVKTYPLKRGVSLDLEAYCTELEDYKKNFPKYFVKEPKIID